MPVPPLGRWFNWQDAEEKLLLELLLWLLGTDNRPPLHPFDTFTSRLNGSLNGGIF